ncbi:hypothetical protein J43TS3_04700 [Ornithinibacillus bavariensis]|uniref:Uncharacterized protein n=1 Tax=Ornithinibacillus bavariensis TaxID=545502 RepID=A0A919X6D0_9BACI|nr:hypothetical protein J43TS3_04700 [Ornithinibacillus bavariensis]
MSSFTLSVPAVATVTPVAINPNVSAPINNFFFIIMCPPSLYIYTIPIDSDRTIIRRLEFDEKKQIKLIASFYSSICRELFYKMMFRATLYFISISLILRNDV